ncbi:MAG: amidohydrolase family protein [Bryobacteraceae bacterium]
MCRRATLALLGICAMAAAQPARETLAQRRYPRLVIRGAMVVDGSGAPAAGPRDIVIENNIIASIEPFAARQPGEADIDAEGKYVLPGLINAHAHLQDKRGGIPQPFEYQLKLWLASGITTIRDVGSDTRKALDLRERSAKGEIAAPRIFIYPVLGQQNTPEAARTRVREIHAMNADGLKLLGLHREIMQAAEDEAHKAGLHVAHHAGVEETNAWDDIRFGTTSIEHFYGIPEAAIDSGIQHFPPDYNYDNEATRFRQAGRLWRQANPEKLRKVLEAMVQAKVAWDPTLSVYEANRDLQRARTEPWFKDYLSPALEKFFEPNPAYHGSYFDHWTSTDEANWKQNYRIWMAALVEFENLGGTIGVGEDAGFMYSVYGFGLIRELEMQQEAGFSTLDVIRHATANNAAILGQESSLGKVRLGYRADLIVVNGNPLEDLKTLYPTGIEWTIKDGIPYHGATLMTEVKQMVANERKGTAGTR